jgi:hypothetical protein
VARSDWGALHAFRGHGIVSVPVPITWAFVCIYGAFCVNLETFLLINECAKHTI